MVNLLHKKSDYPCLQPDLLIKIDNYSEFEFWIWKEEKLQAPLLPRHTQALSIDKEIICN